jgi:hypothetical protein
MVLRCSLFDLLPCSLCPGERCELSHEPKWLLGLLRQCCSSFFLSLSFNTLSFFSSFSILLFFLTSPRKVGSMERERRLPSVLPPKRFSPCPLCPPGTWTSNRILLLWKTGNLVPPCSFLETVTSSILRNGSVTSS